MSWSTNPNKWVLTPVAYRADERRCVLKSSPMNASRAITSQSPKSLIKYPSGWGTSVRCRTGQNQACSRIPSSRVQLLSGSWCILSHQSAVMCLNARPNIARKCAVKIKMKALATMSEDLGLLLKYRACTRPVPGGRAIPLLEAKILKYWMSTSAGEVNRPNSSNWTSILMHTVCRVLSALGSLR